MKSRDKIVNKQDILKLIDRVELPGLKCGNFPQFTDVWMVRVEEKIYVRSGQYVPHNSWYHAFAKEGEGWIKLGGEIVEVTAKIPENLDDFNKNVDDAYIQKYGKKYPELVPGILRKSLQDYTMEFEFK